MIVVNVGKSWLKVMSGDLSAEEATLGSWAKVSDISIREHGDLLVAIDSSNTVVAVYQISGHTRTADDRVTFAGDPNSDLAWLIGQPNPAPAWRRGQSRPIQYADTAIIGTKPTHKTANPSHTNTSWPDGMNITRTPEGITIVLPADYNGDITIKRVTR